MRGGIFTADVPVSEARERIDAEPSMVGRDLAREVTIAAPRIYAGEGDGPRIVALDTGIKRSIIRNFTQRGATLEIYPCTTGMPSFTEASLTKKRVGKLSVPSTMTSQPGRMSMTLSAPSRTS